MTSPLAQQEVATVKHACMGPNHPARLERDLVNRHKANLGGSGRERNTTEKDTKRPDTWPKQSSFQPTQRVNLRRDGSNESTAIAPGVC